MQAIHIFDIILYVFVSFFVELLPILLGDTIFVAISLYFWSCFWVLFRFFVELLESLLGDIIFVVINCIFIMF